LRLLAAAIALETTNNRKLAAHLECSEETVKSSFRRLAVLMETHSRSETLLQAIARGWVKPKRHR
jgi:DNA-binding NarL/FixJ family response regulator